VAVAGASAAAVVLMRWWLLRRRRRHFLMMSKEEVASLRRKYVCRALSVSYASSPLMMVEARGSWMRDSSGTWFLDTRNNVCHVGHCNRRVARAVARQVALVNTNTRYLHPNVCALARRLVETMPRGSKLRAAGVCVFVNSGSEANDLALRMARAFTKKRGVLVLDGAYHGHTLGTVGISPYKFFGGGEGGCGGESQGDRKMKYPDLKADFTECATKPDTYRGRQSAKAFAADVEAKIESLKKKKKTFIGEFKKDDDEDIFVEKEEEEDPGGGVVGIAAMFVESFMSVAGVVVPPPTYLKRAFEVVRSAGGVCVCDEVQTGLGRAVDSEDQWYAFEQHGVDPDVVTLGKPLGNGMPVGAVVASREIADAFADDGPEYFNTFGGNPVCCAAALAVLDEVQFGGLRANAVDVGAYLKSRITDRMRECSSDDPKGPTRRPAVTVGDLRGTGLYLGLELVTDFDSRQPATNAASLLCTALKERHHILTTLDGPFHNVIVLKPPLTFSKKDADLFVDALFDEIDHLATLPP